MFNSVSFVMKNKLVRVELRLTKDQKKNIEDCASMSNMTLSAYIRETLENRNKRILGKAKK